MIKVFTINFLLAISSAMGMAMLPIIATDTLGMSLTLLGLLEGSAELISNLLKLVTGNLFDRMKNKRMLFILPTMMSFLAKFSLLFFLSGFTILASKLAERVSNGMFASPRDAYVAKNAGNKGFALSLLTCFKTLGCVIGAGMISLFSVFIGSISNNVQILAVLALLITFSAFVISCFIKSDVTVKSDKFSFDGFGKTFRKLLPVYILSFVFFLARFNDGVLMLFLRSNDMPEWFYLSTISFFNIAMFVFAPICGMALTKNKANVVLLVTIGSLAAFNFVYYNLTLSPWLAAIIGLVCWGIQRSGAAIIFSFLVAKQTPKKHIGTAIGLLAFINAIATFISSWVSGHLAETSYENVFMFAGIMSVIALIIAVILQKSGRYCKIMG